MWLVIGMAWAGPLDQPDPDEMHGYRCLERPLGLSNNVPLLERTLGSGPPGPPTFPAGLESNLLPFAHDEDLKQAGKKRGIVVYPAVASLSTGGVPVVADCEGPATDRDDFVNGCKLVLQCEMITTVEGNRVTLATRPQVASKFAPVETMKEALGLVLFAELDLFLPMTVGELALWAEEAQGYKVVEPAIPWVEVQEHTHGWLVQAPRRVTCGCEHDVVRRGYWVAKDGRSCAIDLAPMAVAVATSPECLN